MKTPFLTEHQYLLDQKMITGLRPNEAVAFECTERYAVKEFLGGGMYGPMQYFPRLKPALDLAIAMKATGGRPFLYACGYNMSGTECVCFLPVP